MKEGEGGRNAGIESARKAREGEESKKAETPWVHIMGLGLCQEKAPRCVGWVAINSNQLKSTQINNHSPSIFGPPTAPPTIRQPAVRQLFSALSASPSRSIILLTVLPVSSLNSVLIRLTYSGFIMPSTASRSAFGLHG